MRLRTHVLLTTLICATIGITLTVSFTAHLGSRWIILSMDVLALVCSFSATAFRLGYDTATRAAASPKEPAR